MAVNVAKVFNIVRQASKQLRSAGCIIRYHLQEDSPCSLLINFDDSFEKQAPNYNDNVVLDLTSVDNLGDEIKKIAIVNCKCKKRRSDIFKRGPTTPICPCADPCASNKSDGLKKGPVCDCTKKKSGCGSSNPCKKGPKRQTCGNPCPKKEKDPCSGPSPCRPMDDPCTPRTKKPCTPDPCLPKKEKCEPCPLPKKGPCEPCK